MATTSSGNTAFVRNATGLVRSFNWLDALILSLAVTGPTLFGMSSQIGYVAPNGPGADFVTSALIGLLFMIPLGVMYYIFATQMPRSGGDYVWLGRSLNPIIGFVGGWAMFISFVSLLASATPTEPFVVIPDVSVSLGYIWHNPGLVSWGQTFSANSATVFGVSILTILVALLVTSFGPKVYSKVMIGLAAIIFLASFIFIGGWASSSSSTFQSGLSTYTSGAVNYTGVLNLATQNHMPFVPISMAATLSAVPFGVLLFNGFNYSTYISGEVKNAKRSMLWGVIIALAISGILDILGIFFIMRVQGYPFTQAAFGLFNQGKFPLSASPWAPLFFPVVVTNPYIASFVEIGFLLFNFWWAAGLILATSRYVFAFSFDRILPTFFSDVNARFQFPVKATVFTFIIAAVLTYVAVYTTYIGQLLNTTTIWTIVWVLLGIGAIVFPFRRKDLARGLPGGRWILPIAGLLTVIAMGTTFYWAVTIPAIGPSTTNSDILLAVIFGSGIVIYVVRYLYFKGRSIDLGLVLKEIPPE